MYHSLSVKEKVKAIQLGVLIAAPFIYIKENWHQQYYECRELWRTYILRQKDCDNCKYFGGCCCNHIDKNGKCLGWERADLNPIHEWQYKQQIKRIVKQLKN